MKTIARYTFCRLDSQVRGDVVLPSLFALHFVEVEGSLVADYPAEEGLFFEGMLLKISEAM